MTFLCYSRDKLQFDNEASDGQYIHQPLEYLWNNWLQENQEFWNMRNWWLLQVCYHCDNHFRKLIMEGIVVDSNIEFQITGVIKQRKESLEIITINIRVYWHAYQWNNRPVQTTKKNFDDKDNSQYLLWWFILKTENSRAHILKISFETRTDGKLILGVKYSLMDYRRWKLALVLEVDTIFCMLQIMDKMGEGRDKFVERLQVIKKNEKCFRDKWRGISALDSCGITVRLYCVYAQVPRLKYMVYDLGHFMYNLFALWKILQISF